MLRTRNRKLLIKCDFEVSTHFEWMPVTIEVKIPHDPNSNNISRFSAGFVNIEIDDAINCAPVFS